MSDAKVKFGSLSLNNQYQVHFAGINGAVINYLRFDIDYLTINYQI
jgi:hypothetical protein